MHDQDDFDDALTRWLRAGGDAGSSTTVVVEALPGDVSPRRYYRVSIAGDRSIVARYPPELLPAALRFERTSRLLAAAGVRVPAIRRFDADAGLMLLEDVGSATLFDWRDRSWAALRPYLEGALEALGRVQTIEPSAVAALQPPLDAEALERELAMTWDVFLEPNGLTGGPALARRLRSFLESLCRDLEAGGLVPCHRDFMARNLVPMAASPLVAVLDHQDLRLGPADYDAASLLNDSLYPPAATARALLGDELFDRAGYHRAAVQRTLKIVGTFASFARRGQPRHLPLIPVSLARCLEHLAALPEAGLAADLRRAWAGAIEPGDRLLE